MAKTLEEKFIDAAKKGAPLIQAELEKAQEAIKAAQKLAEKHGVPFSVYLDHGALRNEYVPQSFMKKGFDELDLYDLGEKLDLGFDLPWTSGGYDGWQQSYC